jgi:hypothetical protein
LDDIMDRLPDQFDLNEVRAGVRSGDATDGGGRLELLMEG